jgi:hypothetical protein
MLTQRNSLFAYKRSTSAFVLQCVVVGQYKLGPVAGSPFCVRTDVLWDSLSVVAPSLHDAL